MVLSAFLKLDAGAFTTPLGKGVEMMKTAIRVGADLGQKLSEAFDMGGELSDLSSQLGETPGKLMVMRQAFEDAGVGAESLGQTLAIMRKAMGGINDEGQPTGKMFERLGLNIGDLSKMGAEEQLAAIGSAIRGLGTPAEQTAAAMGIFGRSGAKMLTLLKDPSAMDTARATLGGLPALMDRNAAAFDAVSDRIGHIKNKTKGLWAGIAEGLLPLADSITGALDGIDLTAVGQRIGSFLGTLVQLFRDAPLGTILHDSIIIGLGEAINWGATGFVKLGGLMLDAFSSPMAWLRATFQKTIEEMFELLGKIPKVGEMLGLDGFKAESFDQLKRDAQDAYESVADAAWASKKVNLIDVSSEKANIAGLWDAAAQVYEAKIKAVGEKANAAMLGNGAASLEAIKAAKTPKAADVQTIQADALARIGGFVGGGQDQQARLVDMTSQQLAIAKEQLKTSKDALTRMGHGSTARFA